MIGTSRLLGFGSDFTPPLKHSLFTFDTVSFIALNILTLGIYGVSNVFSKQYEIKQLEVNQQHLQIKAYDILNRLNDLEIELNNVRESVGDPVRQNSTQIKEILKEINPVLERLQHQNNALKKVHYHGYQESMERVGKIALACFKGIAFFLINVITVGLYSTYQDYSLKNHITLLKRENEYLGTIFSRELKDKKTQNFQSQVEEIKGSLNIKIEIDAIQQTDLTSICQTIQQTQDKLNQVNRELQAINLQERALKTQNASLKQEESNLYFNLRIAKNQEESLKKNNNELQNKNQIACSEFQELQKNCLSLESDLELAKASAAKVSQLESQINKLKQVQIFASEVERLQSNLGPLASKYKKREEDGAIEGAYGIDLSKLHNEKREQACAQAKQELGAEAPLEKAELFYQRVEEILKSYCSPYAQRVNDKHTAAEILKAEFDYAFDQLLQMGNKGIVHFNESAAIYQDSQYSENRAAIFNFIALDLIKEGDLYQADCHGYSLKLNNQDVSIASSHPECVQSYQINPYTNERRPITTIIFKHIDEFTPDLEDPDLPLGIDPIGAKWAYSRLSLEEKEHLFNLLMAPLIPDNDPKLRETLQLMSQVDHVNVQLIQTTYNLIFDIGIALTKKFDAKDVFVDQWIKHAVDVSYKGINEKGKSCLAPFKKKNIDSSSEQSSKYEQWVIDYELWEEVNEDLYMSYTQFMLYYQYLFENMTTQHLLNPINKTNANQWNATAQLNCKKNFSDSLIEGMISEYDLKHQYYVANQSTLFQNGIGAFLSIILMNDDNKLNMNNDRNVKNILVSYLNKKENADHFSDEIMNRFKITVSQYQNQLKNNSFPFYYSNCDLDAFELKLIAYAFGIRIGIFDYGQRTIVNEYGLIVPAKQQSYFGPNTKETIYFYRDSEKNYFGLFPILKKNVLPDLEEETSMKRYWAR